MIGSVIAHAIERHYTDKALNTHRFESLPAEVLRWCEMNLEIWMIFPAVIGLVILYALGQSLELGKGSHAGREEPRRAYRRELARQMAREDAQKIKEGKKPRRRWMQW